MTTPTPATFVKSVLNTCGSSNDNTPYYVHAMADNVLSFIPDSFKISAASWMHADIRKRALRKKERDAKKAN